MRPLRVLFVTPYVPSRLRPRPLGFIRALARRGHEITVLSTYSSLRERDEAKMLEGSAKVEMVRVSLPRSLWNCASGLTGDLPLQALFSVSPALTAAVRDALATGRFDLVHIEHLRASKLGFLVTGVPRVFDAVDCITSLFERAAREAPSTAGRFLARLDLERTRRYEARLVHHFDGVLVSSEADREALRRLAAGTSSNHGRGPVRDLRVIPNGVDLDYFRSSSAPRSADEIVFVGRLGYHANVAGALHLMRDVMPLVWKRRPAARLTLVGADPSPTLRSQAEGEPRIRVTGHVADVPAYLGTAAVAACLLPYAVGIQNKVLEAMACGTPVVASGPACAGLDAVPGSDLLRADGADEAADAIVRLLGDQALQNSLQAAGRAYVMARHDWNLVVASLEELYQDVLARSRPGGVGQRVE